MNRHYLLLSAVLTGSFLAADAQAAFVSSDTYADAVIHSSDKDINAPKSVRQRIAANETRRNHRFSDFAKDYADFKNRLSKEYNFDYSIDVSYMPQHGAPNGKRASQQILIYPTFSWTNFKNEYGTGTLTAAYNIARYGGAQASKVGSNIGVATAINDYDSPSNSFDELLYTYQLCGSWDWLTVGLGQFPMYNFDGSAYNSNQQVNFINYALSQNASSTYSTAGVGTYVQIAPNSDWTFVLGAQDATNVDGISVRVNNLDEEHYTTFGSISYTPTIKGLGAGQYSILLYNMPSVKEQQGTTNGWSLNLSQDFGDKLSLFARINGVSGNVATINQSWVLGGVYNNPLDRNPLDQIGLAFAYNKIDEKAVGSKLDHDAEKVIEAYWAWGISKWMTLTPDIQFYIDPAENPKSDYATVVSLRATFFF